MTSVVTVGMIIESLDKWADELDAARRGDRLAIEASHVIFGMRTVAAILRAHKIDGSLPTKS